MKWFRKKSKAKQILIAECVTFASFFTCIFRLNPETVFGYVMIVLTCFLAVVSSILYDKITLKG